MIPNWYFCVAEQLRGRWTPHYFVSQDQFINWLRDHPGKKFVDPPSARGKMTSAESHVNEFEYDYPPETDVIREKISHRHYKIRS
jgi:hypothetical protein